MEKPKVGIIFTGGTISMSIDKRIGAAIPSLSSEEIMSLVTNIDRYADTESFNLCQCPGPHMDPAKMFELRNLTIELLERNDITGVVILHGTDTLEETAYLMDLTIKSPKPVVITGAMRNSSELGYDGPSNLAGAVCTVISSESRNRGVLVVLNNEVNGANEVTKTNTVSLDTFKSLKFGPLGVIDNDEVIYYRDILYRQFINVDHCEERVDLIKAVAGMNSDFLKFSVDQGAKGIVLEAMGRGNVPPGMLEGIHYAIEHKVIVTLTSRCPIGRVYDSYGYEGGGKTLSTMGVIFCGDLPGQKLRMKLMLALAKTDNPLEVKKILLGSQNKYRIDIL